MCSGLSFSSALSSAGSNSASGTRPFSLMNQTKISRVSSRITAIWFCASKASFFALSVVSFSRARIAAGNSTIFVDQKNQLANSR